MVWVPAPLSGQGRFMVSVLNALGYRAHLKAIRPVPDIGAYFNRILDSRTRAQVGYNGWVADFPSVSGFLVPQFTCKALLQGSEKERRPQRVLRPGG
jgi:hypothetical protein